MAQYSGLVRFAVLGGLPGLMFNLLIFFPKSLAFGGKTGLYFAPLKLSAYERVQPRLLCVGKQVESPDRVR